MSASSELQKLIIDTLKADSAVAALVGTNIFDELPTSRPYPCIEFGPSDFVPDHAEGIKGREETVQLDIWSQKAGRKKPCKEIVDAVNDALDGAALVMPDPYALSEIEVILARVLPEPDGITTHGVVTVTARIET